MELSLILIRVLLLAIFATAAFAKLNDIDGFRRSILGLGIRDGQSSIVAVIVPLIELCLSVGFIFTNTSFFSAIASGLLMTTFTAVLLPTVFKKEDADCHCFGEITSGKVTWASIVRNLFLIALSVVLIKSGIDGQGRSMYLLTAIEWQTIGMLAVVAVAAICLTLLMKMRNSQTEMLRRIDDLESTESVDVRTGGISVNRDDAGNPQDHLAIGTPIPDFGLKDAAGNIFAKDRLLNGRPSLIFFVGANCIPCAAMRPDLDRWESELKDRFNIIYVTNGDEKAIERKFGRDGRVILFDPERDLTRKVFARWTPAALAISRSGRIASHVATGDKSIRIFVSNIQKADVYSDFLTVGIGEHSHSADLVGKNVPEFDAEDIKGELVTDEDLRDKQTLILFWGTSCPHCRSVRPDLTKWIQANSEHYRVMIFSDSPILEDFNPGLPATLIEDDAYSAGVKLGMLGTPSALIVDENGTVVTETAIGTDNLWAMIGRNGVEN